MSTKAIVTTTINAPTEALGKFAKIAQRDGWDLIIVGDQKTPHSSYEAFCAQHECVTYLAPEDQEAISQELSDLIGWNCIQRRNFGLVEAWRRGAEVIAMVDDDNIPYDFWGTNCRVGKELQILTHRTELHVFDPLSPIYPQIWHRGFPIQLLDQRALKSGIRTKRKIQVQADLWDGDPDVDAVARIALAPDLRFPPTMSPYTATAAMPFNSQNTFISREVLPDYFLFPHIGRMDDIWGAYFMQAVHPDSVIFSKASVKQERNEHDLVKDMEAELIGYRHTVNLVADLFIGEKPDIAQAATTYLPEEAIKAWEVYRALLK